MKKSLLALAVLGAYVGVASAQSSVTLYGTVDVSARYVKNDGSTRRLSLANDGLNSSQLGFRGVEDLGGGLKASFLLLASVGADAGNIGSGVGNNKFWNRRSTVSLSGNFGEVRLGRDYVPTFWNTTIFDPFGTNGVGSSLNVARFSGSNGGPVTTGSGSIAPTVGTYVRADNSIGYFLPPNIGGIYGQAMAAAAENTGGNNTTSVNGGRYLGGRIGWAAGPIDIAGSYGQTRSGTVAGRPDFTVWNVGASYDFGFLKLMGQFNNDKSELPAVDVRERRYLVGAVVPMGQGEIHGSWVRSTANVGARANQWALGYVYNLSKRTALYGTASWIRNDGNAATGGNFSVAGGTSIVALPTRGEDSRGAEIGVRHFF